MKAASSALVALLASGPDQFRFIDLFQVTLRDGSSYYYSSGDISVTVNGQVYSAGGVRIDGMGYKCSIGLDTDQQTVTLSYRPTELIAGVPWAAALANGVLDGCFITRSRAFYSAFNQPPVGVVPLFYGMLSTATSIGRTGAIITVSSLMMLLDTEMPINTYQTGCTHSLYDAGCTLAKTAYAINWTVAAGSTNATVALASDAPTPPAPLAGNSEGLGLFVQGTVQFTSGVNEGLYCTIASVETTAPYGVTLAYPLATPPSPGDTITLYPGCDKTTATCTARFNNLAHFRGFPYTPSAETVY